MRRCHSLSVSKWMCLLKRFRFRRSRRGKKRKAVMNVTQKQTKETKRQIRQARRLAERPRDAFVHAIAVPPPTSVQGPLCIALLLASLATLLAGCMVGPDYRPPQVAVPS